MMKLSLFLRAAFALICLIPFAAAVEGDHGKIKSHVDGIIPPLMEQQWIPGMAVAVVTQDGSKVFNYGVASKQTGQPVTDETLFELGSITKTFTATLAAYAAVSGKLNLAGRARGAGGNSWQLDSCAAGVRHRSAPAAPRIQRNHLPAALAQVSPTPLGALPVTRAAMEMTERGPACGRRRDNPRLPLG